MTPAIRRTFAGFLVAVASAAVLHAGLQQRSGAAPPAPKAPKGMPGEAWPDAKTIEQHRVAAENRKLFASQDVFAFTLTADFKTVNGDKNENSTKVYPGTIEFPTDDGKTKSVQIEMRPRGHSRRKICFELPLRLTFPKDEVKGTLFDGVGSIKLGVHCRSDFEDYVPREYTNYKIYNMLTPFSFRARLAKATYVDVKSKKVLETRYAMFIEDDDDVAKRMSGRITDQKDLRFAQVDKDSIVTSTVFEYMISNLDVSLAAQHNMKVVEVPAGTKYAVPYDFDYSGLVNASYSQPPPNLQGIDGRPLESVRVRLYRGPCLTAPELQPYFDKFQKIKADVMSMFDSLDGLKSGYRSDSKQYLERFYHTIDRPDQVKKEFIDGCKRLSM
jgi:hypothetical protein